jgi:hypothetical protein
MIQPVVLIFLVISAFFAFVHFLAVEMSLYWYYWWFDILMHFWGGLLIALGVVVLSTFRKLSIKPTFGTVVLIALGFVIVWELFEWQAGLYAYGFDVYDTALDMFLGVTGAIIGQRLLRSVRYRS